jgi:hypothetical protein
MKPLIIVIGAALLALAPRGADAQDDKRVHFNVGGGPTFAAGTIGEHFNTGWGPAVGLTFDASKRIGIQFEYAYRYFSLKDEQDVGTLSANHQTQQLDFNVVANLTRPGAPARGYVITGPGMYYRKVEITQYTGTGVICDPWLYVCGTYPVESIIGSRGGWDFGFNIGGGVGIPMGDSGAEFFIETRYHYVVGPKLPQPAGSTTTTPLQVNGNYWPLTFGIRF